MSFSQNDIAGVLTEYEQDYQTGIDISQFPLIAAISG